MSPALQANASGARAGGSLLTHTSRSLTRTQQMFLRTTMATDWGDPANETTFAKVLGKVLRRLLPDANPSYSGKMHLVDAWYIEFGDDGYPWREIGVDANGSPVLAGPSSRDYGFWLDTNMTRSDFDGVEVSQEEFEALWSRANIDS